MMTRADSNIGARYLLDGAWSQEKEDCANAAMSMTHYLCDRGRRPLLAFAPNAYYAQTQWSGVAESCRLGTGPAHERPFSGKKSNLHCCNRTYFLKVIS